MNLNGTDRGARDANPLREFYLRPAALLAKYFDPIL
jgi:hypothetical protein